MEAYFKLLAVFFFLLSAVITHGRSVCKQDDPGCYLPVTILHEAAMMNNVKTLSKVIEDGAKVETRATSMGVTALHIAAWWGHPDAVHVLLLAGADPQLPDAMGRTALDWALQRRMSNLDHREYDICIHLLQASIGNSSSHEDVDSTDEIILNEV